MKKISMIVLGLVAFTGVANARYQETVVTETVVTANPTMSVARVMNMPDDANVIVTGNIIRPLGGDKYLFQDSTGSITVDIDDSDWRGLEVTEVDTIRLRGSVDKNANGIEIDVDYIERM